MTLVYNKFNRGVIDSLALARDDVKRVSNSARRMRNFMPVRLGPMMTRPGFEYIGDTPVDNSDPLVSVYKNTYIVPFFGGLDNTALLEFSDNQLRIWANDELVSSTEVVAEVSNGTFNGSVVDWTKASDVGCTAVHYSGSASLTGDGTGSARLYQSVSVIEGTEHTLQIVIKEAPCRVTLGTTGVDSDDIFDGVLGVGTHTLVFTPTFTVTITLRNTAKYRTLVDSVMFLGTGPVVFDSPITDAQLPSIRYAQSADVLFITYGNGPQFRVERRGIKSWSVVEYRSSYGPFGFINDSAITLSPSVLTGNGMLVSSEPFFTPDSVGETYKLLSDGQNVVGTISAEDSGTNSVRVTGVGEQRQLTLSLSSVGTATVTLQRSSDNATWIDINDYTNDVSQSYNDTLDNSISYYRWFVKSGNYGTTPIIATLEFAGGSIEGICRVTEYVSTGTVNIQVLSDLGSTDSTRNWYKGEWSTKSGYPTCVSLYEGRLWFAGKDRIWGSVSDEFTSFDDGLEGSNRSIAKTIGFGPVDTVNWLEMSSRLIMGIQSDEVSVRSSSFGEILTSENTNLKSGSSQGAAPIAPVRVDDDIMFVQTAGRRLFGLSYSDAKDNHATTDMNLLCNEITKSGYKRIVVVRQPETRIIGILNNGTGVILTYDQSEDVQAWSTFDHAAGPISDIVTIRSVNEDRIYVVVQGRLERMFLMEESTTRPVDSAKLYTSPGLTLTGLDYLENRKVQVWADNKLVSTVFVDNGQITLDESYDDVVVGLPYKSQYESNKLSTYVPTSVLTLRKRVESIGMVLEDFYPSQLKYGPSFTNLSNMPTQEQGTQVSSNLLVEEYDEPYFPFNGSYDTDSRVCIETEGPAKILALIYDIKDSKSKNQTD